MELCSETHTDSSRRAIKSESGRHLWDSSPPSTRLAKLCSLVLNTGMQFANPPIVELVAELRWVPGISGPTNPDGSVSLQFPLAFVEQSLETFRTSITQQGFNISERLIPGGFPTLPFAVVQRFRKSSEQENYAYQLGWGIFSANALPPYRNWDSFRPIVQSGVQTLFASRHPTDRSNVSVILRYLDVFSDEMTGGRKSFAFLNDILGIEVLLPRSLSEKAMNMRELQAQLQVSIPLQQNLFMKITVQDGTLGTKSGVIMTTEVFSPQAITPSLQAVMSLFEEAHNHIRTTFMDLTAKIHDKMRPVVPA